MYLLPSTSVSVAPWARSTKNGVPPTAWNARTGLSTPPGRICEAWANSCCDFGVLYAGIGDSAPAARLRLERARGFPGVVGDDDVGAGAPYGRQRLHHDSRLFDPAALCRSLDHRVLPAHLIGRRRLTKTLFDLRQNIEVRQRRLDHDDVGAFGDV